MDGYVILGGYGTKGGLRMKSKKSSLNVLKKNPAKLDHRGASGSRQVREKQLRQGFLISNLPVNFGLVMFRKQVSSAKNIPDFKEKSLSLGKKILASR